MLSRTNPIVQARGHGLALALAFALALTFGSTAWAEKADRSKPMVVEADKDGVLDLQRQVLVYTGNVVISQGTMVLRADRIELRELPDGYRTAMALGSSARPASWRQKRDGLDETVEGTADRIEFDGRADTLRFMGNGSVRRLRGGAVADEITGGQILWDNTAELFRVEGGATSVSNPSGRVRAVLSPRVEAASAPAMPSPPVSPATPGTLSPARALGAPQPTPPSR